MPWSSTKKHKTILEINNAIPLSLQAKLLQVIEHKTFERVGESKPTSVDFRVVSATNQDLRTNIRKGNSSSAAFL